jgi:hypothetical protein
MKPLPGDHRHRLLIEGSELKALQSLTWAMAEAFGLDRKIENYKGTRPLTLYRWDLECLMDVIGMELKREPDRRNRSKPAYPALKSLGERLHQEYNTVYGHEKAVAQKDESLLGRKALRTKPSAPAHTVYQFKITLLESHPPIWRRIQVKDCTLDKLHEHIQMAMGWTNSHLHHFKIGEQFYGDPDLMQENFEDMDYEDSTTTKISDILPKTGRRFRFLYEYDFGDSWNHEVHFVGAVRADPKVKYPLCLEGERACPPEDCGGVWRYADFVEAIQNPDDEQHGELLEWVGGGFDPEEFDPAQATKAMRKGLPDWRRNEWF